MSDMKELIIYQKYYDLMLYSLPIIGSRVENSH